MSRIPIIGQNTSLDRTMRLWLQAEADRIAALEQAIPDEALHVFLSGVRAGLAAMAAVVIAFEVEEPTDTIMQLSSVEVIRAQLEQLVAGMMQDEKTVVEEPSEKE